MPSHGGFGGGRIVIHWPGDRTSWNGNLTPVEQTVKRFSPPRSSDDLLIEPIKKTRVAGEVADRIRTVILDGTFPQGLPLASERVLTARFVLSCGSIPDALRTL